MNDLTVALPVYNEEETIAAVIGDCCTALDAMAVGYELLVIDNMSSDRTVSLVRNIMERNSRVWMVEHRENLLYSGSCATAMRKHRGQRLVIMDSDGQMDPSDIPNLVKELDSGFDVVFGKRVQRNDPIFRLLSSQLFNIMGRLYLGFPFDDLNCGIRAMSGRATNEITIRHRINMANPEIYASAAKAGLSMSQIAVRHRRRLGGVSSHDFGNSWRIFREVRRYFRDLRRHMKS